MKLKHDVYMELERLGREVDITRLRDAIDEIAERSEFFGGLADEVCEADARQATERLRAIVRDHARSVLGTGGES